MHESTPKNRSSRRKRAGWVKLVAKLEASGMAHRPFAEKEGVRVESLRSWLYRLRREAGIPTRARRKPVFVEVRPAEDNASDAVCRLLLGNGMVLELAELPSTSWLREVAGVR